VYASYLQQAHSAADGNLDEMLSSAKVRDAAVFVLSGNGSMPVHTCVRLNTILADAGLLQWGTQDEQLQVSVDTSKAFAIASGGSAYIFVNLVGSERSGVVEPEDYSAVVQQTIDAVAELADQDGQPVVRRALEREDLDSLHLDSPESGDIFVQSAPGYCLSDELGFSEILAPSAHMAMAGFDARLPEMRAFLVAAGGGLVSGQTIPHVHVTDIAPTIALVLGFGPSHGTEGRPVEGIWR
jgi:predicted AlkP superfamily phosphohydrolase/phosphomutase